MKKTDNFIFTENTDYSKTGKESIWGKGDKETLDLLDNIKLGGKWLNLTAGDGRYNTHLLKKVNKVIASDIDKNALLKLKKNTPLYLKNKLNIKVFNLTNSFPFGNNYFDGVFCTGTLHLFPSEILEHIMNEIDRVTKPNGKLIIDFATDIKRELPDSKFYSKDKAIKYTLKKARNLLKQLLKNYRINFIESEVPKEKATIETLTYLFSCKFLLIIGEKFNH